ncbi:MAG: NUDIX hydrolase [Terracidiphilus sp.]|jgi:ADP-ribose pyrophosphatase
MPKKKKKAKKAAKPKAKKAARLKAKKSPKPKKKKAFKKAKAKKPKAKKALKKAKAKKPKTKKALKKAKAKKPKAKKALKKAKALKPKVKKALKALLPTVEEAAELLSSETVFEGPLFRVLRDRLIEPGGKLATRDIIRHNGSVVVLAIDNAKNKRDPWVVVERQYRHAAGRFLWELPAGKLEPGEDPLLGAQRELAEETGYRAKKWKPLVEYYASPGFLGESMKVFVAEGLMAGDAHQEDDEQIAFRLVKLSELLKLIEKGAILDGKTLSTVLLYARNIAGKGKK